MRHSTFGDQGVYAGHAVEIGYDREYGTYVSAWAGVIVAHAEATYYIRDGNYRGGVGYGSFFDANILTKFQFHAQFSSTEEAGIGFGNSTMQFR